MIHFLERDDSLFNFNLTGLLLTILLVLIVVVS